jgi:HEXXH motif-containing protein
VQALLNTSFQDWRGVLYVTLSWWVIVTAENTEFKSFTVPGLPGIVFVSPASVASARSAAEALLHEAIHLKFIDIDYFQYLFCTGFRQESSPKITPPWRRETGYGDWPIDRLLTSMHVYLSLTVYFGTAAIRPSADRGALDLDDCSARARQCRDRASWLLDEARNHFGYLSASGRSFVAWIAEILSVLDTPRKHPFANQFD